MKNKNSKVITMVTKNVNGNSVTRYNGKKSLYEAVSEIYPTHGALYENEFGVSREDAYDAGWHPEDGEYMSCNGFRKFIRDKGIINKEETTQVLSVMTLVLESMEG